MRMGTRSVILFIGIFLFFSLSSRNRNNVVFTGAFDKKKMFQI